MAGAGLVFAVSGEFWILVIAATIGVISVTGGEVGPFLAVEQASLSVTSCPTVSGRASSPGTPSPGRSPLQPVRW